MKQIQDFEQGNDPPPLTRPTEFPLKKNEKGNIPDDPDPQ